MKDLGRDYTLLGYRLRPTPTGQCCRFIPLATDTWIRDSEMHKINADCRPAARSAIAPNEAVGKPSLPRYYSVPVILLSEIPSLPIPLSLLGNWGAYRVNLRYSRSIALPVRVPLFGALTRETPLIRICDSKPPQSLEQVAVAWSDHVQSHAVEGSRGFARRLSKLGARSDPYPRAAASCVPRGRAPVSGIASAAFTAEVRGR